MFRKSCQKLTSRQKIVLWGGFFLVLVVGILTISLVNKVTPLSKKQPALTQTKNQVISEIQNSLDNKKIKVADLLTKLKEEKLLKPNEDNWKNCFNSALNMNSKLEIVFVVSSRKRGDDVRWMGSYNDWKQRSPLEIFQKELTEYEKKHLGKIGKGKVIGGDITDFSCHQAPVIVNHLNMEGKLNGRISQAVVAKSGKSQQEMENDIKQQSKKFNELFSLT